MIRVDKISKEQIINALKYVADYDFQKVAWLASKGPIVSSLEEDFCQLFDDTGLTDAVRFNQTVFGSLIDDALLDLRRTMEAIDDNKPVEEVLDDSLMQAARQKAKNIIKLLEAS